MKKRILGLLTVLCMLAALVPCVNAATSGTCGENVTWTLDDEGTLTISGEGDMTDYYAISSVPWYSNRSSIVNVVIEYGVTSIGDFAFYYCSGLTSATIGSGVTSIGERAFSDCESLTSVTIPNSVTEIGDYAFYNTGYYNDSSNWVDGVLYTDNCLIKANSDEISAKYEIKSGTRVIADYAFYECSGLTSVTISDSVTSIGYYAFLYCEGLTSINVDSNNQYYCSIDGNLFNKDKTKLIQYAAGKTDNTYVIPDSVTMIVYGAFYNCYRLTSVTIPNSVTTIGVQAFSGCESLTSIIIPDSVMGIGSWAFSGCESLTSVTIPDSVTSIGRYVFQNCSGLTSVTIPDSVTSIGDSAFYRCSGLTSFNIPDSVTSIGRNAFYRCSGLTSFNIPDSVTNIGEDAFYGTGYYSDSSNWENGVLYIDNCLIDANSDEISAKYKIKSETRVIADDAFNGCRGLTSVTIPDSVTSIGEDAFAYCTGLTNVTIPDSVTSIGRNAFYDTAYYNDSSNWENGVLYIDNCLIEANDNAISAEYEIKSGTRVIADYAFYRCSGLTSVTISNSVTEIGESAFSGCSGLTSVTIPDSVTSIGDYAFYNCTCLTSINVGDGNSNYCSIDGTLFNKDKTELIQYATGKTDNIYVIPDSVTSIGDSAFSDCYGLTSVTIPNSVTSIGGYAFYNCSGLTDVYYGGSEEEWNEMYIGTNNGCLTNATIHYNSLPEATTEPSAEPTTEPTTEPSAEPTTEPTTEPTSEPTPAPEPCFTVTDGTVTNTAGTEQTAAVIIAAYDADGALTGVTAETVTFGADEEKTFTVPQSGKIFVWNSLGGMVPLTK